jgi:acetyltransferase-like isoleucine patch superfamily enzyme
LTQEEIVEEKRKMKIFTDNYFDAEKGGWIYPAVEIGDDARLEPPYIIGKPPRNVMPGDLKTIIGTHCIVRPFTTIYSGNAIGDYFQTGQNASIREDNRIGHHVSVGSGTNLEFSNVIGDYVRIHSGCFLEMATIEDHVFLGPNAVLLDDPHPMNCPKYKECLGGVTVKRYARIGANVTILPGVTIGDNALVGAGSVVVKDVPPRAVVTGNPARVIKTIDELVCKPGFFDRVYEWEEID